MKYLAATIIATVTFAAVLPAQEKFGLVETELDNGLKILVLPLEGTDQVACRLVYNVGGADDRPGYTGMAHYLEHMMFKGSDRLGSKDWAKESAELDRLDEIAADTEAARAAVKRAEKTYGIAQQNLKTAKDEIEGDIDPKLFADVDDAELAVALARSRMELLEMEFHAQQKVCDDLSDGKQINSYYMEAGGTGVNAYTSSDRTVYTVNMPANRVELFFMIESERMTRCSFREFYKEKKVVQEERLRAEAGGRRYMEMQLAMIHEATPYRHPVLGWPSDIDNITRPMMMEYYDTYYVPNNAALVIAGPVDAARVLELANKYFAPLDRKPAPPRLYTVNPLPAGEKTLICEEADRAPDLSVSYVTVPQHHRDAELLRVFADWLDSDNGPLYRDMVTDSKAVFGVWANAWSSKLSGSMSFGLRPRKDFDHAALVQRLNNIVTSVLNNEENYEIPEWFIAANAARWQRRLTESLTTPESAASLLVNAVFAGGVDLLASRTKRLSSITAPEVLEAARKYIKVTNRVTSVRRPPQPEPRAEAETEAIAGLARVLQEQGAAMSEERRKDIEQMIETLAAQRDGRIAPEGKVRKKASRRPSRMGKDD